MSGSRGRRAVDVPADEYQYEAPAQPSSAAESSIAKTVGQVFVVLLGVAIIGSLIAAAVVSGLNYGKNKEIERALDQIYTMLNNLSDVNRDYHEAIVGILHSIENTADDLPFHVLKTEARMVAELTECLDCPNTTTIFCPCFDATFFPDFSEDVIKYSYDRLSNLDTYKWQDGFHTAELIYNSNTEKYKCEAFEDGNPVAIQFITQEEANDCVDKMVAAVPKLKCLTSPVPKICQDWIPELDAIDVESCSFWTLGRHITLGNWSTNLHETGFGDAKVYCAGSDYLGLEPCVKGTLQTDSTYNCAGLTGDFPYPPDEINSSEDCSAVAEFGRLLRSRCLSVRTNL